MNSELAIHAYVFLGNSLNLLVNRAGAPQRAELGANAQVLSQLHRKVEPLTPGTVLGGVDELSPAERKLLLRVCVWCVERLGDELGTAAGVTQAEADEVIVWLAQGVAGG